VGPSCLVSEGNADLPTGNRRALNPSNVSYNSYLVETFTSFKKNIKLHISIGMFTPFQFMDEQANWSQVWSKMVGSLHGNLSFDQILG